MGDVIQVTGTNGKAHVKEALRLQLARCPNAAVLNQHWPWIKDRLENIRKKNGGLFKWTPKYIRQLILLGLNNQTTHELWFAIDEDHVLHGFAISYTEMDPFINLPDCLYVWLGSGNMKLIRALLPQFEAIARDKDIDAIQFKSPRQGWTARWIGAEVLSLGFKVKEITYRKDLA